MDKRWVMAEKGDAGLISELSKALNINVRLSSLLLQRGITNFDEAKKFFRPDLKNLHDPFLMKDMDKAVQRILTAVEKGEKLMIYGDYDVDGTTAVSLVYSFLRKLTKKIEFYIPDRYEEGYGISYKSIDFASSGGFTLMIALDCGIKAVEKVKYAKEKGLDIIICDHHRPGDTVPEAVAVLDPKQNDCNYPFKELSGCGVGFKLIQAIARVKDIAENTVFAGIDLVAISIAADIVPIVGENRILTYFGMKKLNEKPRAGIASLLKSAGVALREGGGKGNYFEREISITDLVFLIGPRINAAGRIEHATDSVKLLISHEKDYAEKLGKIINDMNVQRRDLDNSITIEAVEQLRNNVELLERKTTVVFNEDWHKGVIGIVASRLIETFYKPTIVLTKSNGLVTGSARSIKNFDIYDAIDACSHLLEHFGGHTYAAGLAMKPENLDTFINEFEQYANERLTDEMMVPELEIDEELYISDINAKFFNILKQFAPFGPGNMNPTFVTNNVIDTGNAKLVGKNDQKHIKFSVVHTNRTGNPVPAIGFNLSQHFEKMKKGVPFNICYHIEENNWLGNTSLQLRVKDIKFN